MRVLLDPQGPSYTCNMKEHRDPPKTSNQRKPQKADSPMYGLLRHKRLLLRDGLAPNQKNRGWNPARDSSPDSDFFQL